MSEAWRKHPLLTNIFNSKHVFPGWKLGVGAFVLYCAFERVQNAVEKQKALEAAKASGKPLVEHETHHHEPVTPKWIITKKLGDRVEVEPNPEYIED